MQIFRALHLKRRWRCFQLQLRFGAKYSWALFNFFSILVVMMITREELLSFFLHSCRICWRNGDGWCSNWVNNWAYSLNIFIGPDSGMLGLVLFIYIYIHTPLVRWELSGVGIQLTDDN
jgi:hypothetical protein